MEIQWWFLSIKTTYSWSCFPKASWWYTKSYCFDWNNRFVIEVSCFQIYKWQKQKTSTTDLKFIWCRRSMCVSTFFSYFSRLPFYSSKSFKGQLELVEFVNFHCLWISDNLRVSEMKIFLSKAWVFMSLIHTIGCANLLWYFISEQ
jgi:hypothetical protein